MAQSLLEDLLPSWQLSMRAERKSPSTIRAYSDGIKTFLRWCTETGTAPELTKPAVQQFLADLLAAGAEANTAKTRDQALKRYAAWLFAEGEIDTNPLLGLKPPQGDDKVVNALTDEQLKRLLKACQGTTLINRRDEAIVRLMFETGIRAAECVNLQVADVNLIDGIVIIHRGKGGKGREVPFSVQTATAIDRYLRMRKAHRLAADGALWLGARNRTFGYDAMANAIKGRARTAGIEDFHLHRMRHTAATRWLRAGGSEGGLMAVGGWRSRDMLDRYARSSASSRAAEEARRLNLGDI